MVTSAVESGLPRITIVTPSFNQGAYLRETIESVLGQDYPNLEYIVIDGGSTDGSVDIIRQYETRLAYWVSEKDRGQSHALNKGFQRATGEWLNWLNSDDVLFPGALHAIAAAVSRNNGLDLVSGINAVGDERGRIRRCNMPASPWLWHPRHCLMAAGQQSTFFRRDTYCRVGGLNEQLHLRMDSDLYLRILKQNGRGAVIPVPIGFFRHHGTAKRATHVDVYRRELRLWWEEDHITALGAAAARTFSRVCRIFDGSYIRSLYMTAKYQGRSMSDVWHAFRDAHGGNA